MGTRSRDFIFLGLALAFLATAILLVRRGSAPPTVPAARKPGRQTAPAAPAAAPGSAALARAKTPMPKPARNPFATPSGVSAHVAEAARKAPETPASPAAAATAPAPAPTPAPDTTVPALPAPSLPPLASPTPPVQKASGPVLAGVIGGTTHSPTAIIRSGNQRYFAKQGDKVAGRYTVQSVSNQQVVLVSAQGKLTLKMGGS